MRELTAEDFKGAIKNPFYHKLCREVNVGVKHESYAIFEDLAKQRGVTPEMVMQRCLDDYAKILQAHE